MCRVTRPDTEADRILQAVSRSHTNDEKRVPNIGQDEARHRKYKRLKLGGDQAYDRSSD
jgi:hypothetical protein